MLKLRQFILFVHFVLVTDVFSVTPCGDNEVYDICAPKYPSDCLSNSDDDITACAPGCRCLDNYLRNDNGQCVPIEQLECDGENEVSGCENTCFPQTCHSIGKTHHCSVENSGCKPECRCKENYFRNTVGDCISKEDCLQCTGPNEYFSTVGSCDKFCDNLDQPASKNVDVICINMCRCEEGYARNSNNTCVLISECSSQLKCTGPNEYFSSNGKCDKFCANLKQGMETSSPIDNRVCGNICHCEDGYARDFNNTCVPISKCPKLNCVGPNEESGCHIPCPPQTCGSLVGIALPCIPPPLNCQPECRCKDGYYRNKIGECISKANCLKCTGPNEYFSSADLCDKFCYSLSTENQTSLSNIEVVCINMCHCDEGYVRDSNNDCVLKSKCPPKLNCVGENEVAECHNTCPQTCESIDKAYSCPLQAAGCKPECRCKTNYYRNKIGQCISKEDCLKCAGPNEYFSTNGNCDNLCASLNEGIGPNTAIERTVCGNICHCEDGYARDFNNTCVPISKCPILECLGQNEVSGCYIPCPPQTCTSIGGPALPCVPPPINCQPECRCKDGYYRNKIGECISKADCLKCTGPNEYFSTNGNCDNFCASLNQEIGTNTAIAHRVCGNICHCEDGYARDFNNTCVPISKCPILECLGQNEVSGCYIPCPPQTCTSIGGPALPCVPPPINCQPECRCKDGFYRNKIGECISKEDCLKCTGPNEYFSTNGNCDNFCASLNQEIGTKTAIAHRVCGNICHCEDGYARDFNNTCVPISKCPILECLGQNEVSGCYIPCPPQTCTSIGGPALPCVPPPINCQPECRCKDGYYRNKIGECISKEDCLQCTGANEYFSPAGPCDSFCSTPGPEVRSNSPDRDVECINMCHCEKGYVRNSNNTCVPVSSCTPQLICTGPNEYFTTNGTCDKFCALLDENGASSFIDDRVCGTQCHCEEGYARDFNNTCVPISQCPKLNCSGENEVSSCYVSCPPQTCESIATEPFRGKCVPPPVECLAECRCKNNYYRNKIGECISREDCLKCSGPNEYFSSDGACDKYCASLSARDGSNYLSDNSRCGNICHCEQGYARDFNNTCVPISECPKLNCSGENEVSGCHIPCPPQTCESIGGIAIPCISPPVDCQPECRCKNNYFRNKIGECISKEDCLKCTGPHEYFSFNNTTDKICATSAKPNKINSVNDDTVGKSCHCEEGYARASNSTCIPISKCPEDDNTSLYKFEQGNLAFTQKFLYMAAKKNPGVSVIFSALSILILLAQVALYATGPSLLQLLRLLNLDNSNQIRSFMPNFLNTLNSEHNITFNIADNVYSNIDYTYRPSFITDSKRIFNADVQNLDFCNKVKSAETINNWVANKTNNLIAHLISPDMLDCDTVMVLLNAIYFKGDWKYKFDPKNTQKTKFIVDKDKNVTVNMMKQTGYFKYAEIIKPGVQVLIMPYKNDQWSFMILLPKNKYGINDIISKINKRSFSLSRIINNTKYTTVNVKMPIISTTTTTDLKDPLMKNNVTAIFNYETSGLQNILSGSKPIKVSYAIQKATIIVSETGSEAAAASGVIGKTFALPLPPVDYVDFNADHQFIYFILDRETPIFAGLYAGL